MINPKAFLLPILLACAPLPSFAQCYKMYSHSIGPVPEGQLCFDGDSSAVGYHQFTTVRVIRNGITENISFYGDQTAASNNCVRGREQTICHKQYYQAFGYDLGFGEKATIRLNLPDLEQGEVYLPERALYRLIK